MLIPGVHQHSRSVPTYISTTLARKVTNWSTASLQHRPIQPEHGLTPSGIHPTTRTPTGTHKYSCQAAPQEGGSCNLQTTSSWSSPPVTPTDTKRSLARTKRLFQPHLHKALLAISTQNTRAPYLRGTSFTTFNSLRSPCSPFSFN
jgi:hypothetical protein